MERKNGENEMNFFEGTTNQWISGDRSGLAGEGVFFSCLLVGILKVLIIRCMWRFTSLVMRSGIS